MIDLTFWHWWILALVLLVLEVFAPGAFFLWMGVGAGIVGAVLLVAPDMGWEYQLMIFSVFSIVAIAMWKIYIRKHPTETDRPTLNRRGEQYVGRVFTLDSPIVNGSGKIRVDDSTWKIRGEDCEAGTRIEVVSVEGTVLKIRHADRN